MKHRLLVGLALALALNAGRAQEAQPQRDEEGSYVDNQNALELFIRRLRRSENHSLPEAEARRELLEQDRRARERQARREMMEQARRERERQAYIYQ